MQCTMHVKYSETVVYSHSLNREMDNCDNYTLFKKEYPYK